MKFQKKIKHQARSRIEQRLTATLISITYSGIIVDRDPGSWYGAGIEDRVRERVQRRPPREGSREGIRRIEAIGSLGSAVRAAWRRVPRL